MRTHAKPQPIQSAIAWMARRNATHLYLLVDPATMQCIKIGSLSTVSGIMADEDGIAKGWRMVDINGARQLIDGKVPTESIPTEYQPSEDEITDVTDDEPTKPVTVPSGNEANDIVAIIRRIAGDSINEATVRAIVDERLSTWDRPQATVVEVKHPEMDDTVKVGVTHNKFPDLLRACSARDNDGNRLNVLLLGPAGTSKSTAARQAAEALGLPFYPMAAIESKYELFGFIDANGNAVETACKKAWRDGGVLSLDELSACGEGAVLALNGALATGYAPFPDGAVKRHPDCVVICSDNVFGAPTAEYNARNKLDGAFMDRFVKMDWPIDEALELAITGNDSWVAMVHKIRDTIKEKGIRGVMITPRASIYGASLIRAGMDLKTVARMTCQKNMSEDQWLTIERAVGL